MGEKSGDLWKKIQGIDGKKVCGKGEKIKLNPSQPKIPKMLLTMPSKTKRWMDGNPGGNPSGKDGKLKFGLLKIHGEPNPTR